MPKNNEEEIFDIESQLAAIDCLLVAGANVIANLPWRHILFLSLVGSAYAKENNDAIENIVFNDPRVREICTSKDFDIYNRAPGLLFYAKNGKVDFEECFHADAKPCVTKLDECTKTITRVTPPEIKKSIHNDCLKQVKKQNPDCEKKKNASKCLNKRKQDSDFNNDPQTVANQMAISNLRQYAENETNKWLQGKQKTIDRLKAKMTPKQQSELTVKISVLQDAHRAIIMTERNKLGGGQCGDHATRTLTKLLEHQKANGTHYVFDFMTVRGQNSAGWDNSHNFVVINNPMPGTKLYDEKTTNSFIANMRGVVCDTWHRFFGRAQDDKTGYLTAQANWILALKARIGLDLQDSELPDEAIKFLCESYNELGIPVELPEKCRMLSKAPRSEL